MIALIIAVTGSVAGKLYRHTWHYAPARLAVRGFILSVFSVSPGLTGGKTAQLIIYRSSSPNHNLQNVAMRDSGQANTPFVILLSGRQG
ncbi:MAG TPA: hypothetical protein PLZ44_00925 [Methanothrix sp.]|nr:hypothetical protein [Methanothrix sp.]